MERQWKNPSNLGYHKILQMEVNERKESGNEKAIKLSY